MVACRKVEIMAVASRFVREGAENYKKLIIQKTDVFLRLRSAVDTYQMKSPS